MFHKIIDVVNWMEDPFCFEAYWQRLQQNVDLGGPSAQEAKRDYQVIERCKSLVF